MIARGYLKDVKAKKVSWLWKPYIAFGKVTLIQGDTGIGKTSLLIKVKADLSNGVYPPTMFRECLQPQEKGKPLTTYYISIENGIDDTIVPLFDLLGGNREYVQYQEERNGHFVLTGDEIRECVKMTGARLIVVDPWQQFLDNASSTGSFTVDYIYPPAYDDRYIEVVDNAFCLISNFYVPSSTEGTINYGRTSVLSINTEQFDSVGSIEVIKC